jgi:hypothetical protein
MFVFLTMWWFWISLAAVIALVVCEATESPVAAAFSIIVAILGLQFLADVNIFGYVVDHPLSVLQYVAGYFTLGAAWGIAKWWMFALKMRDMFREYKEEFYTKHNLAHRSTVSSSLKKDWETGWNNYPYSLNDFPPKASKYKVRIVRWIAYWPPSVLWSIFNDLFEKIARAVYETIARSLQSISDRVFRGEEVKFEE